MVPPLNEKPSNSSHLTISPCVRLCSRPFEVAACANRRFGPVGPGRELNQRSQIANSFASVKSTGSCLTVSKQFRTSPGLGPPPLATYEYTNPDPSIAG